MPKAKLVTISKMKTQTVGGQTSKDGFQEVCQRSEREPETGFTNPYYHGRVRQKAYLLTSSPGGILVDKFACSSGNIYVGYACSPNRFIQNLSRSKTLSQVSETTRQPFGGKLIN